MRYKIVEYADGSVDVMYTSDNAKWYLEESFDGPHAWDRAKEYVRDRIPQDTVMREVETRTHAGTDYLKEK